jgi:hypothetical protein
MEIKKIVITTVFMMTVTCAPAFAKEGGDQYPNGAEGWGAGALPPPGSYFLNYMIGYSGKLKNGNGGDAILGTTTPSVDAAADALRFIQITDIKLLGGNWGWHLLVPVVNQNLDIKALGGNKSVTNIGDITIDPFVLSWHGPEWHFGTGLEVYVPTGAYNKNGVAPNGFNNSDPRRDIGTNYWSIEPIFAATYLSNEGLEASSKFMLNFKTENSYTKYQSGDEFHFDYLVAKHIGHWAVGIGGYFLEQFTNDTQGGHTVTSMNYFGQQGVFSDGRKGQVFAFGPSAQYQLDSGQQLQLTWDHETLVRNRFGGDKVVFKFVTSLW